MKSELDNMEFISDRGKNYFSGVVGAEVGFKCVDDCPWKREEWR